MTVPQMKNKVNFKRAIAYSMDALIPGFYLGALHSHAGVALTKG